MYCLKNLKSIKFLKKMNSRKLLGEMLDQTNIDFGGKIYFLTKDNFRGLYDIYNNTIFIADFNTNFIL